VAERGLKEARKVLKQARVQYERTGAVDEAEADICDVEDSIAKVIERMVCPASPASHVPEGVDSVEEGVGRGMREGEGEGEGEKGVNVFLNALLYITKYATVLSVYISVVSSRVCRYASVR
jgi:hypothetical protein